MIGLITNYVSLFLMAIVIDLILCYPMMLLWNYCLVPAVLVFQEVTFLQMFGILFFLGLIINPPKMKFLET